MILLAWYFWVWGVGQGDVARLGPYVTEALCLAQRHAHAERSPRAIRTNCVERNPAQPGDPPISPIR